MTRASRLTSVGGAIRNHVLCLAGLGLWEHRQVFWRTLTCACRTGKPAREYTPHRCSLAPKIHVQSHRFKNISMWGTIVGPRTLDLRPLCWTGRLVIAFKSVDFMGS